MREEAIDMTVQHTSKQTRLRPLPPAPHGFDPFAASAHDLARHGLPRRPDPSAEPELAELWERKARQYRGFEYVTPVAQPLPTAPPPPAFGPDPIESSGYTLTTSAGPFTSFFVTWTVPDLTYDPDPFGINTLHTFAGLGFLDVHVTLTVAVSGAVGCRLWAQDVGDIALSVRPGDVLSAALCLNTDAAGTAAYFITNETTAQMMSFSVATGFPPAVTVNAGISRDGVIRPGQSIARFGTVYFDEISAYTTSGSRSLTAGDAISMVDRNGRILARPVRLNDFAFKTVYAGT
jgi:hypothetical protein